MGFPDYKRALLAAEFDVIRVLDRYFHSGQSFAYFGAPPEEEPSFKSELAHRLYDSLGIQLHPLQLIVCGSAHLGFSPVPTDEKFGKPFNPTESDIDVAVVSLELFEDWWTELQLAGMVPAVRTRVAEELFWGFINPATVYNVSETGRKWWEVFGNVQTDRAKGVRGRLYRNFWSMENYHKLAINGGRKRLLRMRT